MILINKKNLTMKNSHKISVIIPVYNAEKYLKKCIDSIINQTYSNLEIILVNDGSTDDSGKTCDLYKTKDQRIKVLHKENGGASSARNVGLNIATGDFIAFVDSDDYIDQNTYKELLNLLLINNLEVIEYKLKVSRVRPINDTNDFKIELKNIALERIFNTMSFSACVRLYKKEILNNVRFELDNVYEDAIFTIAVFERIDTIGFLDKSLYIYNIEDVSINRSPYNLKKLKSIDAIFNLKDKIDTMTDDMNVKEAFRKYLINFLNKHYISLFQNSNLDNKFKYRKKLKSSISKLYKVSDSNNMYHLMAFISPLRVFKYFVRINDFRIKLKIRQTIKQ
tara:strand:+ start:1953 stop:2963 length:1011 start_codon:yes stop_codon:yes gene_type:complete